MRDERTGTTSRTPIVNLCRVGRMRAMRREKSVRFDSMSAFRTPLIRRHPRDRNLEGLATHSRPLNFSRPTVLRPRSPRPHRANAFSRRSSKDTVVVLVLLNTRADAGLPSFMRFQTSAIQIQRLCYNGGIRFVSHINSCARGSPMPNQE